MRLSALSTKRLPLSGDARQYHHHRQHLRLQTYSAGLNQWGSVGNGPDTQTGLRCGETLKIVSWNLEYDSLDPALRALGAMDHLRERFGPVPENLVVMLQEVCPESLKAILNDPWVQENFKIPDLGRPESACESLAENTFEFQSPSRKDLPYFNCIMVSRTLQILSCFRTPLESAVGRDALFVDIPVSPSAPKERKRSIRLCTTHLESLRGGKRYRKSQLTTIPTLLKEVQNGDYHNIDGLVGGDMSPMPSEHAMHQMPQIGLKDIWGDVKALDLIPPSLWSFFIDGKLEEMRNTPVSLVPGTKPWSGGKDLRHGREQNYTWGYQSGLPKRYVKRRLDKFFCTGVLETITLLESQDKVGAFGRLGIGCQERLDETKYQKDVAALDRGDPVPQRYVNALISKKSEAWRFVRVGHWISNHFGVTVGIKVKWS